MGRFLHCGAWRSAYSSLLGEGIVMTSIPLLDLLSQPAQAHLLDRVDVGVVVESAKHEIIFANQAALDIFGAHRDGVLGSKTLDPTWDVMAPDGTPVAPNERPGAQALMTGQPVRHRVLGVRHHAAPERVWILVDAEPLSDASGRNYAVLTIHNITAEVADEELLFDTRMQLRRAVRDQAERLAAVKAELEATQARLSRAQRELAVKEELYRAVFEGVQEGLVVHDHDGAIRTANPAAEQILGLTAEQLRGRAAADPRWQLEDSDGLPIAPDRIPSQRTLATGEVVRRELVGIQRPDGERRWLRVSTNPIEHGLERTVVATFSDVSRERRALSALEKSRARFERLTEAVPGVLFQVVQRLDGTLEGRFVSRHVENVFGIDAEQARGEPQLLIEMVDPEDRQTAWSSMQRALEQQQAWETVARLDNGRCVRLHAVAALEPEGIVWNGVILDVTQEHALAQQLEHSQRREAMGDLAAGVAHNFNNALAAILPNLEELRAEAEPKSRRLAEDALRAARNAADLVRQLMLTTRRETGPREAVDLARVVSDVVLLCRRSFDRRIQIDETVVDDDVAPVLARESELHQVLLNLCINARDAMRSTDAPHLVVSLSRVEDKVIVEVRDNGIGMSPEVQARLGEPFFTTKAPGEGTGLGLATVYKIMDEIGGSLRCDSAVGAGTRFTMAVPTINVPAIRSTPPASRRGRQLAGHSILVVDDDHLVRRAMRRQLKRLSLEVEEACDGIQCLERLRSGPVPDALVLDLSMPRLGGEEVLSTVRTSFPDLPVIVVSGHVPERAALSEATAVLIKPLEPGELGDALARALRPQVVSVAPLQIDGVA